MHPILIRIGPLTLHTYGVFVALGFIVGLMLALHQGKKEGFSKDKILDIGFYTLLSAIIGSRLFYVLVEYKYYIKNPIDIFKLWQGGLVFFGGLLLALLVLTIYFRKNALPVWKTLDLFAPSLAIGHAIGRLGCFSAGCCHGKPANLPWSVTFTNPDSLAIIGVPVHPTQLYEALSLSISFGILILIRKYKRFNGQIFWTYAMLYSVVRFTIEFFRGDEVRGFIYKNLSIAQGISVVLFITAIFFMLLLRKKKL
jgi:phosphatidylglycerol:prolipoprotein diacylglycerol transferase